MFNFFQRLIWAQEGNPPRQAGRAWFVWLTWFL